MNKDTKENMFLGLVALVVVLAVANTALLMGANGAITTRLAAQQEEARPAQLSAILLQDRSCSDCVSMTPLVAALRKGNVNVTERTVDFSSGEGQTLAQQYGIARVPGLILTGEVNKSGVREFVSANGEFRNGAAIVTKYDPPYYDIAQRKVIGRIAITHLSDSSCTNCTSLDPLVDAFKGAHVSIASEKTVAFDSDEGKELIERFSVRHIPAIIVSSDIGSYSAFKDIGTQLNITERSGFYALHATRLPYRDLTKDKILGLVSVTYLTDSSCGPCANMTLPRFLRQSGVFIVSEKRVDVQTDEGKALVNQSGVTTSPSLIVSKDIDDYALPGWAQVNKTLSHDQYVLPADAPPYRDLRTGTLKGAVQVVYLNDSSCQTCYAVTNHRAPLARFGVSIANETFVDVASDEGKVLIVKYNITKVPTLLLSSDASLYGPLTAVWLGQPVGIIAPDGWYVFTAADQMGTHKDLTTGQVVTATQG